jgi:diaminopimelate epimerase
MRIPFVKMHGAGNDFVVLDGLRHKLPKDRVGLVQAMCHRRFGVGADQVLIVDSSKDCDFAMTIHNADGGEVEMCGNGIRCFAKYLRDVGLTDKVSLTIETLAGVIRPTVIPDHPNTTTDTVWVRVDMGTPELAGERIPVRATGQILRHELVLQDATGLSAADPRRFEITCVAMGNPHCVIFVPDVAMVPVERVGPLIERDGFFPNRVNVEFVAVKDRHHLIQRTWERGAGETYACGTGACAVAVAGVLNGLSERDVRVALKGGDLDLCWDEKTGHVFKTGPATTVFEGTFDYAV